MIFGIDISYLGFSQVGIIILIAALALVSGYWLGRMHLIHMMDKANRMNQLSELKKEEFDVGIEFFGWLKANLLMENFKVNHPGASVYFTEEGVFILTPNIVDQFLRENNQYQDAGFDTKAILNRFYKYLLSKKSLIRTQIGIPTHTYEQLIGTRSNVLVGVLIPRHLIFNHRQSQYNVDRYLKNLSGFHEATQARERLNAESSGTDINLRAVS